MKNISVRFTLIQNSLSSRSEDLLLDPTQKDSNDKSITQLIILE